MPLRQAACTCGQLTATTATEPGRISICHCLACQWRTGSVFSAQARFPADSVTISGPSTTFVRVGDTGGRARFHFCPVCGDTVYYVIEAQPELVAIPIGAFADPEFSPPFVSVYEERMHRWLQLPEGIERHD
ncbi:MAG: GFA family protein [Planctomycetaceae bacterium]|jgi:hypothetical protein|nr:GFA family protein [Planctomycetaceae bacterium]